MALNVNKYKANQKQKITPSSRVDITSNHKSSTEETSTFWDFMNRDIQLFGSGWAMTKKERFYNELEVLLTAGLDIQQSLSLIEENQKNEKDKLLIHSISETIINGAALSEALDQTKQFSNYEIFSIKIGEESGQLQSVLTELATYFNKNLQYKKQLISALSYPVFVILFAFGVIFFLLNYLVPMFSGVYKQFDKTLPAVTQTIINLSNWMQLYSGWLFLAIFSVIILIYSQRNRLLVRRAMSWLLIHLPIFGTVIRSIYLARFCQSMSLLLNAKVPLLKSVQLVHKMIAFYPIEVALASAEQEILTGEALYQTLQQHPIFPNKLVTLVRVGEEASQLDTMFQKLAQQYNNEIDNQTSIIGSLIEPVLIIGLGVLVGFILVAMYLPLFQLSVGIN